MALRPVSAGIEDQEALSAIARKRKLLNAMLAAAMQDTPSVVPAGPGMVQANWGDSLGKAFQAYMAREGNRELDARDAETATRVENQRQNDVRSMFKPLESDIGPQGNEQGPLPAQMGLTPDLQSAQTAALSTNPELQKTGIAQAQEYAKQMAQLKAKNLEIQSNFANGQFSRFDPATNQMSQITTERYGPMVPATPTTPAHQVMEGTKEIKPMGGGALAAPGVKFNQQLSEAEVKSLSTGRDEALKSVQGLQNIANVQTTLAKIPRGTLGTLAGLKQGAAELFGSMGSDMAQQYNTVATLHSAMGQLLIEQIRAFAPVTKEDVDRMQKIVGSTSNTEAALAQIIQVAQNRYQHNIYNHNAFTTKLQQKEGYGDLGHYMVDFSVTGENLAPAGGVGGPSKSSSTIPRYDAQGNRIN